MSAQRRPDPSNAETTALYIGAVGLAVLVALWRMPLDDTHVGLVVRVITPVAAFTYLHLRSQRDRLVEREEVHEAGIETGFDIGLAVRHEENVRRMPQQRRRRMP